MDEATYAALRRQARPLTRCEAEAEDLVQDTLLAALLARRREARWLAGVLRNLAAMRARGAARRRAREALGIAAETFAAEEPPQPPPELFAALPPAARRLARLALHGLDGNEIRWILGLSPAAFRQRLSSIRSVLRGLSPRAQSEARALAAMRDPVRSVSLPFGRVRGHLKAALRGTPGLATHDVDGHLLVIRGHAHIRPPRGNKE
jgi:DNA-directed RNA polymerase specialized sigma24 family protein